MCDMKDSGVEWIGNCHASWQIQTIGSLFKVRNEKVNDTDYPPLSVTKNGIVPQMENVAKSDANDNRKMVLADDFVINSRSDRKQSCGVSLLDGSVSLINTVLYPVKGAPIVPAYMNYLLKNYGFAEEFYRWGHGIVADLWTTRWQEMKNILLPMPTMVEQQQIIEILDKKMNDVDRLIGNVQTQIEKLKAYKQSLITEVVTKGLDPTMPMKGSGVEWIGEIPEYWSVVPLKSIFSFGKGLPITKENLVEEGIPVISYGQIHAKWNTGVTTHKDLLRYVNESYLESNQNALVKKGDLIMADTSEDREGCGNCAYIDTDETVFAGYHTIILNALNSGNNKYFAYLFLTDNWRSQIRKNVSGVKLFSISRRILGCVSVLVPDNTEDIVDYLDAKCEYIDRLIAIKQSKIEKLEQYKRSLIYEYVTGKKEVS